MTLHVYFLEGSGLIGVNRTVSADSVLVKDFSQVSQLNTLCIYKHYSLR